MQATKKYNLIKDPIGYFKVEPSPSLQELNLYYAERYYQESKASYRKEYSKDELRYFEVEAELAIESIQKFKSKSNYSLLDLGCGEGFFANHFYSKGHSVECTDFSDHGIKHHNPQLLPYFYKGEVIKYLDSNKSTNNNYDLINLDNVLEHVIDPLELLKKIRNIMTHQTILRVEVPNDFSDFQSFLLDRKVTEKTWINPPEHLNYFNKNSLKSLFEIENFELLSLQADYPIEQFLLADNFNYTKDRNLGGDAHLCRVLVTNYLANKDIKKLVDLREVSAELDFGRVLTAYFSLKK